MRKILMEIKETDNATYGPMEQKPKIDKFNKIC